MKLRIELLNLHDDVDLATEMKVTLVEGAATVIELVGTEPISLGPGESMNFPLHIGLLDWDGSVSTRKRQAGEG